MAVPRQAPGDRGHRRGAEMMARASSVNPGPWAPVNAGAEENAEAHDQNADLAGTNSSIHIH